MEAHRTTPEAEYLPPKACSALFSTPESTLANLRWQRRGPPYIKRGSRILYPRADFERWLESQRIQPDAA
ncbi:MAG: helix-turn-helix domain-containing protein [Deltaproteobacteria bacterium]|nr:helix-turn-helix domain-containing protein [Deltaproteobacteria bacterium]